MADPQHTVCVAQPDAGAGDLAPWPHDGVAPPERHDLDDGAQAVGQFAHWVRGGSLLELCAAVPQAAHVVSARSSPNRDPGLLLPHLWRAHFHAECTLTS